MVSKELNTLDGHIQALDRMSRILFEIWDDSSSAVFRDKCIGAMIQEWKQYLSQMQMYSTHLKLMMQEMDNMERNMEKLR